MSSKRFDAVLKVLEAAGVSNPQNLAVKCLEAMYGAYGTRIRRGGNPVSVTQWTRAWVTFTPQRFFINTGWGMMMNRR